MFEDYRVKFLFWVMMFGCMTALTGCPSPPSPAPPGGPSPKGELVELNWREVKSPKDGYECYQRLPSGIHDDSGGLVCFPKDDRCE